MRVGRIVVLMAVVVLGGWAVMHWATPDLTERGGDPNVGARSVNTAGLPVEGTSGRAGTAWTGDEAFVAQARHAHAALAGFGEACRQEHLAAAGELESLAGRRQWTQTGVTQPHAQTGPSDSAGAHAQALAAFTQAESQASDPELRAWAAKSAAMMRGHMTSEGD